MNNSIGEKIAILRKTKNLSQNDLAKELCVSNKTISKWECGNSVPDVETLKRLADYFHVSVDYFVNKDQSIENHTTSKKNKKLLFKTLIISLSVAFVVVLTTMLAVFIPREPKVETSSFDINTETSTMSCVVNNANENFSFNGKINVPFRNTWKIYSDINAINEITSNVVQLEEGDNTFYLLVTNSSNDKKLYTIVIRRKPMYTIIFNSNGGSAVENQIIEEGELATEPNAPTKTGYTFTGWDYDFTQEITENKTINASWVANTNTSYVVEYYKENVNDNGYTLCSTENYTGTSDSYIETPVINYEHFEHQNNGTENGTISADGTSVFKHYYKREIYTIQFNFDGGHRTGGGYSTQYIKYEASATEPTCEKEGYTFASYNLPLTNISESKTIVAVYTINQYAIIFDTNGGDELSPVYFDYNAEITNIPEATKTGYSFQNWNQVLPSNMPAHDITIVASWTINQYTITFNTMGGNEIASITQDYDTNIISPDDPTRTGYTFTSWDTSIPAKMPAQNITIVAQWQINQYTITFNTMGGNPIDSITQDYDTDIITPADPTRTGYTFINWDTTIPTKMPAENITIVASWTINQYTITFNTMGGNEIASITQDYDTNITSPDDPTRTGYTFTSWNTAIPTKMPAENMTIVAQWQIIVYTITYQLDIGEMPENVESYTIEDDIVLNNPTRDYYSFNWYYNDTIVEELNGNYLENLTLVGVWTNTIFIISEDRITGLTDYGKTLDTINVITMSPDVEINYISAYAFKQSAADTFVLPFVGETYDSIYHLAWIFNGTSVPTTVKTITITNDDIDVDDFRDCSSIESISIMQAENINNAFYGCVSLTTIYLGNDSINISDMAFYNCTSVTTLQTKYLPAKESATQTTGLTTLLNTVTTVELLEGITNIPSYSFYNCTNITNITIPLSVVSIGDDAFTGCTNIAIFKTGYLPTKDTSSATTAFSPFITNVSVIELLQGITEIPNYSFYNCTNLTEIIVPNSVTNIGDMAFARCSNLTEIVIPNSITIIGLWTFHGSGLTQISIPASITAIGENAFYQCNGLTEVFIPSNILSIGSWAFADCANLESIIFDNNCQITSIPDYFCYNCRQLNNFTLPNNIISIGENAFSLCNSLNEIIIPICVTAIGENGIFANNIYCEATTKPINWDANWKSGGIHASIVYWYSEEQPTETGNYWHYVNNEPVIWE